VRLSYAMQRGTPAGQWLRWFGGAAMFLFTSCQCACANVYVLLTLSWAGYQRRAQQWVLICSDFYSLLVCCLFSSTLSVQRHGLLDLRLEYWAFCLFAFCFLLSLQRPPYFQIFSGAQARTGLSSRILRHTCKHTCSGARRNTSFWYHWPG
jgi:hypothetical protein